MTPLFDLEISNKSIRTNYKLQTRILLNKYYYNSTYFIDITTGT